MRSRLFIFLFVLFTVSVHGQTLRGVITNQFQQAIQGAHILNKTSDHHYHSDEAGNFIVEHVHVGDSLQFSHINYQSAWIVVDDVASVLHMVLYAKTIDLDAVVISPEVNSYNLISDIDIGIIPVNSSQDVLRTVPGLFIGQHAGGGKAEQIFLRGFDIDHGTDIRLSVDGLPVNMVSHAHGQGYSDLHFVIPETIEKVDFGKGLYYEDQGNFNTAGYVQFNTKQKLDDNLLKLEAGQFDSYRMLALLDVLNTTKNKAYVASEYISTNGPFESPQDFNRINVMAKYTGLLSDRESISVLASHFQSSWDASGQIPVRAVLDNRISRFGAIDDTEGGSTARTNILMQYQKSLDENTQIKSSLYISQYDFELYSNFTFFLMDSIRGDQIRQKEQRQIYGWNSQYTKQFQRQGIQGEWKAGLEIRSDRVRDNELSHTANRKETIEQIQLGQVDENNLASYVGADIRYNKWSFHPALRYDYFNFFYLDDLHPTYRPLRSDQGILSPKMTVRFQPSTSMQWYFNMGKGFHSNDSRFVAFQEAENTLPAAYGADLGYIWKPNSNMLLNMAVWYLYLEQEFVYVGDAGIVEASGQTRRQGIEISYRYQPYSWLYWNLDANYTHARSIEENQGEDFIPLAPDFTFVSGINIQYPKNWSTQFNIRYMDNRPANEDNSIVAEGYTVADLAVKYNWRAIGFGLQIQNLFNTEWNETQFATESRLKQESIAVEEIHFTPGTPFFAKIILEYHF